MRARRCPRGGGGAAALVAIAGALAAQPEGTPAEQVVLHDASGRVSVPIPATWKVRNVERADFGEEIISTRVLSLSARRPGVGRRFWLNVFVVNGSCLRPLAQAGVELAHWGTRMPEFAFELGREPLPHLVVTGGETGSSFDVTVFRRTATRGLHVRIACEKEDWPELRDAFFELASTVTLAAEPWPKDGSGATPKVEGGIAYCIAKNAERRQARAVKSLVKAVLERLRKIHGPMWEAEGEEPRVYVHAMKADHLRVTGEEEAYDVMGNAVERRVLAVTELSPGSTRVWFVERVAGQFLADLYGYDNPRWLFEGETAVAVMRVETGRGLPSVTKDKLAEVGSILATLAQLHEKWADKESMRHAGQAFAYVATFHEGPSQYRKAYRSFLAALRATCDADAAAREHLLSLDQEELRSAAQEYVTRLRIAAPPKR